MEMYNETQRAAAELALNLCSSAFDFPHGLDDGYIILEYCAVTNPGLKITPPATISHTEAWKDQKILGSVALSQQWADEINKQSETIRTFYIHTDED